MRILIQGTGSIGQRHYRNALALGHDVAFLRTGTARRAFVQEFFDAEAREGRVPAEYMDLDTAVKEWKPDACIIANPNHLHLDAAIAAARLGLHLLIEKPLHDRAERVEELRRIVEERKLAVLVGYNLRFHPLLSRVKTLVDGGALGRILSASVEVGESIEDWHPWEDYRDTYAPNIATGGGALLCFSHDIDYLYWLLGKPERVEASGGKITPLSGDAEDLVQSLWTYADRASALLHIDYFQRPKVRILKIVGTERSVVWDAYGDLQIINRDTGEVVREQVPEGFDRNDMFIEELRHFVSCIETGLAPRATLSDGLEVVRIIETMKTKLV